MAKLYSAYQSQGLVFYRVDSKENPETVRAFLTKESLQFPVLLDRGGEVERLFGVWVHPTTYVIDKQGKTRYRSMGVLDWTSLQGTSVLDQLLKEK